MLWGCKTNEPEAGACCGDVKQTNRKQGHAVGSSLRNPCGHVKKWHANHQANQQLLLVLSFSGGLHLIRSGVVVIDAGTEAIKWLETQRLNKSFKKPKSVFEDVSDVDHLIGSLTDKDPCRDSKTEVLSRFQWFKIVSNLIYIFGTGMDTQDTSPSVLLFFDKQRLIFKARERLSFTLGLIFSLSWTLHCVQQQLQQILCMKTSHVLIHVRRLSTLKDLQIGGTLAETEEPFIVTCVETFSVNYKFQYPYLCSHFHCHTWGWHPPFHQGS